MQGIFPNEGVRGIKPQVTVGTFLSWLGLKYLQAIFTFLLTLVLIIFLEESVIRTSFSY